MAIITLSRQVAAHGDEVGAALASKLNYRFIKRTDIEKRIVELGFPESKLPKYDERKPGFIASLVKDRDEYFNISKLAMLEAAEDNNVIIIGRGAFSLMTGVENHIAVRCVADEKTRVNRLMEEFSWTEKQAHQRIQESDTNRDGFHRNFYNVDVADPSNYHMVLNTGAVEIEKCAELIADCVQKTITIEKEDKGLKSIANMIKAQTVINKLVTEYKLKIEFMNAKIHDGVFTLYGVADSQAIVEQALRIMNQECPDLKAESSVSIVQNFKAYQ